MYHWSPITQIEHDAESQPNLLRTRMVTALILRQQSVEFESVQSVKSPINTAAFTTYSTLKCLRRPSSPRTIFHNLDALRNVRGPVSVPSGTIFILMLGPNLCSYRRETRLPSRRVALIVLSFHLYVNFVSELEILSTGPSNILRSFDPKEFRFGPRREWCRCVFVLIAMLSHYAMQKLSKSYPKVIKTNSVKM